MSGGINVLAPGETGLYGKIASRGDFINRRVPSAFVQVWDEWLQRCHTHCKEVLGGDWEEVYQAAPVWWFMIAAGTCGESAWAGIFQPSVDRVGRLFPLTVAAQLPSDIDTLGTLAASRDWFESIQREAEMAFQPDVNVDTLDARLFAIPFPVSGLVRESTSDETLPITAREIVALSVAASVPVDFERLKVRMREQQRYVGASHCVWFALSPAQGECTLLISRGLPDPSQFRALMDGRWELSGWEVQGIGAAATE